MHADKKKVFAAVAACSGAAFAALRVFHGVKKKKAETHDLHYINTLYIILYAHSTLLVGNKYFRVAAPRNSLSLQMLKETCFKIQPCRQ